MTELSYGDKVTVTTETINDGESFEATVLSGSDKTHTVTIEPENLDVVEMAVVGIDEIKRLNTNPN